MLDSGISATHTSTIDPRDAREACVSKGNQAIEKIVLTINASRNRRCLWLHIAPVGDAGRLFVPRSKTNTEGAGAYAFLSARTMTTLADWRARTGSEGAVFRRLHRARRSDAADVWTAGA